MGHVLGWQRNPCNLMPFCAGPVRRAVPCCICVLHSPAASSWCWWVGGVYTTSLNRCSVDLSKLSRGLVASQMQGGWCYLEEEDDDYFIPYLASFSFFFPEAHETFCRSAKRANIHPSFRTEINPCSWKPHNLPSAWFRGKHPWVLGDANVIQDYSAVVFRQIIWEFFHVYCLGLTLQWILCQLKRRVA